LRASKRRREELARGLSKPKRPSKRYPRDSLLRVPDRRLHSTDGGICPAEHGQCRRRERERRRRRRGRKRRSGDGCGEGARHTRARSWSSAAALSWRRTSARGIGARGVGARDGIGHGLPQLNELGLAGLLLLLAGVAPLLLPELLLSQLCALDGLLLLISSPALLDERAVLDGVQLLQVVDELLTIFLQINPLLDSGVGAQAGQRGERAFSCEAGDELVGEDDVGAEQAAGEVGDVQARAPVLNRSPCQLQAVPSPILCGQISLERRSRVRIRSGSRRRRRAWRGPR
jgi:hypothetical protein